MSNTLFGVELCQCEDPYEEGPYDGVVLCETCHGVVRYVGVDAGEVREDSDE